MYENDVGWFFLRTYWFGGFFEWKKNTCFYPALEFIFVTPTHKDIFRLNLANTNGNHFHALLWPVWNTYVRKLIFTHRKFTPPVRYVLNLLNLPLPTWPQFVFSGPPKRLFGTCGGFCDRLIFFWGVILLVLEVGRKRIGLDRGGVNSSLKCSPPPEVRLKTRRGSEKKLAS